MIRLLASILALFAVLVAICLQSLFTGPVLVLLAAALAWFSTLPLLRAFPINTQYRWHLGISVAILLVGILKNLILKRLLARAQMMAGAPIHNALNLSHIDVVYVTIGYLGCAYLLTKRQERHAENSAAK